LVNCRGARHPINRRGASSSQLPRCVAPSILGVRHPNKYMSVVKKYIGCSETFSAQAVMDIAAAAIVRYKP
jgi:hypothetical protein